MSIVVPNGEVDNRKLRHHYDAENRRLGNMRKDAARERKRVFLEFLIEQKRSGISELERELEELVDV